MSGDREGADAEAERVLGAEAAPALARWWADGIARKLPPFDRLTPNDGLRGAR